MAKLGKNSRLGTGTPASPLTSVTADDWYVIKKYRSDDEAAMERDERNLHVQPSEVDYGEDDD
jgi:hypothetical protein